MHKEQWDKAVEEAMRMKNEGCSCEEVAEHLFELLDSQMPEDVALRLKHHCAGCEHCNAMADAEIHVREIIRRSCCQEAPSSLRMRIVSQIAQVEY